MKLAIDTTSGFAQLALLRDEKVVVKKSDRENSQAEEVAGLLGELLEEQDCRFEDVSEICCLVGPGSFTGIRVSVAFVKGLTLGSDIKIIPVSNFHFFLANFLTEFKNYTEAEILIDCGKNKAEFYLQKISQNMDYIGDAMIISYDEVKNFSSDNLVIGNFSELIKAPQKNFLASSYKSLKIENIFKLADLKGDCKFEPLYIRPTYVK